MNDFSYDQLPYPSKFFVQSFPDRLATQATLFGMEPAEAGTCRLLELGCGNGSNLIAQAYLMPEATFVGVDLAKGHIDDAIAAAEKLELRNVEFRQMDVTEMSASDFGKFDYITAHGLFSWVPEFVRTRVLKVYRELLNENGVGYLSYSAYPGAHQREMVQRAMRFAAEGIADPIEKVRKAMSFLQFLAENTPDRGTYQAALRHELLRHAAHDAADIFHDDLSELNRPFYFHEFAELLASHGLQYLAEAELHAMGSHGLTKDAQSFIEATEDVIEREQMLDLVRGRQFRQTLFCRSEIVLDRKPKPESVDRFLIASSLTPRNKDADLHSKKVEKFVGATNLGIELDQPLIKAMLAELGSVWGRAIAFPELVDRGKKRLGESTFAAGEWEQQIQITRMVLMQIAMASSMAELHLYQPAGTTLLSDKPQVNRLARWQMQNTGHITTTLGQDMKIDDPVSRRLLELLDGTHDGVSLERNMAGFIRTAEGLEDRGQLLKTLPEWIDESLSSLARLGVFEA
jgi:SAM-dependent methyltransferase